MHAGSMASWLEVEVESKVINKKQEASGVYVKARIKIETEMQMHPCKTARFG